MDPIRTYWQLRLETVQQNLEANNFEAHVLDDLAAAKSLVLETLIPQLTPSSVSWGGSMTLKDSGIHDALAKGNAPQGLEVIDTWDKSVPPEQVLENRRRALLVDLFFTGANAVTETGKLVNLDMIGNRVAALTFGPRNVIVLAGRNKIVRNVDEAITRIKTYASPANAMRLNKKTPCVKTAQCQDCKSPERICNTWTITEKSFPKGRVNVILVNQDLGL